MFDWYRRFGPDERRAFWACFGGWGLDALDVQLYSFAIPALILVWHITKAQAGLLATSTLVISAFGGWIAGMFADRVGRARLLCIMVAWFAFFTFLSGFTQNFEQLLVVRGLQGFGFGGEWAAGSVLMAAFTGPKRWNRARLDSYECGIEPTPQPVGGGRFPIKYYLTAMLFIVFDIEIIFLYPWAVAFDRMGLFGLVEMVLFIVTVLVAYAYIWRRGGLEWD